MKLLAAILLASLIAGSCVHSPATRGYLLPSEILKDIDRYDGTEVVVGGYLAIVPHRRVLMDSKRAFANGQIRGSCLGVQGRPQLFHKGWIEKQTTFRATVHKRLCGPDQVCLYWCSHDSGVIVSPEVEAL